MSLMYMDNNANAVSIPTDDHLDINSDNALSNAGFCEALNKAGGGIKYQCGTYNSNEYNKVVDITFDEPFDKIPIVMLGNIIKGTATGNSMRGSFNYIIKGSISQNGFSVYKGGTSSSNYSDFNWIAIEV